MKTHGIWLGLFLLLAAGRGEAVFAGEAVASLSEAEERFAPFCEAWMRQLAAREQNNLRNIRWRQRGGEVEGEYVGYSQEHARSVKTSQPTGVPVGRLVYREFRYRKRGAGNAAAAVSGAEVVDVTEITEIFRYAGGEWVY